MKFYCTSCGYSFNPRNAARAEPPKSCPYCDKQETLIKEQTANDLLKEI
jgi:rubrerythrin